MNNKFTTLGHGNVLLAIILDSLSSIYNNVEVEIISNITKAENRSVGISFLHEKIETKECHVNSWKPNGNERFILLDMAPEAKKKIYEYFRLKYSIPLSDFVPVSHSSSVITNGVELSSSVNISPLSVIVQYAKLGHFVTINRNVFIGHHTTIDDRISVNPDYNIGGNCKIGKNVVTGIEAIVLFDDIEIGNNTVIGAGAVMTKDVGANTLVYGSPAKFIRSL